jgi:SAM-dependent methyltransferase
MIACPGCATLYASINPRCPRCDFAPTNLNGIAAWAPELSETGGGFKAEYFGPLVQIEPKSFWFQARNQLIIWALETYFPKLASFLELGCGTGFVLSGVSQAFPQARLVGSEIFAAGLTFAAARVPTASLVQMDARRVPYVEEFDVAAAFDVIEHIDEDELVLQNLHHAIRAGGGLLITVPQHQWLWSATDDHACHQRRYSAADLHAKIRNAGFDILRSTSFVSLLLPAMLVSRRQARTEETFDPLAEFEISRTLNEVLRAVLAVERQLIRRGVNFSLGGSRLVIARKTPLTAPLDHSSLAEDRSDR